MRFFLFFILLFSFLRGADAANVSISDFLQKNKAVVWTTSSADFQKKNGSKGMYRWNSEQKKSMHYATYRSPTKALYFLDWRVTEADFNFENDQLSSMSLNLYNKTCATNKSLAANKKAFFKFLKKVRSSLNTFCKKKHTKISVKLINSARCQSCVWNSPNTYIVFKWSFDGSNRYNFIANYATVYIYKNKQFFDQQSKAKAAVSSLAELKALIKVDKDGTRHIQIPMVDQGQRGYCVVACAERILKYYKVNIDQHILAQAASTSNRGTRATEIQRAMKRVGSKCNFHVKELSEYSPLVGTNKMVKFVKKYNRLAKKAKKSKINLRSVRTYNQLFKLMDEDLLAKTKKDYDKSGFRKFKLKVKSTVDSGMPVLWGVMLGMVKEAKIPQNTGGHMRLITGYNPKTNEMIYSDSWGKGHDFKRISWEKAWVMTTMAYVFIPKNMK